MRELSWSAAPATTIRDSGHTHPGDEDRPHILTSIASEARFAQDNRYPHPAHATATLLFAAADLFCKYIFE